MIQDDEYECFISTPERIKALGFKPQKETLANRLLPYADKLDDESNQFLDQVKTNLAKAVMLREMKPACAIWVSRLMKYLSIYGLKFGKEDHIAFIKLAYELVLIPDLEPCKVHKFATLFQMLTKKRFLISPEELTLPWRPLYELGIRIFDKNATSIGMFHYQSHKTPEKQGDFVMDMVRKFLSGYGLDDALQLFGLAQESDKKLPTSLDSSYLSMIKCARPYFDVNATQEILDQLLPLTFPWAGNSNMLNPLSAFLPVGLPFQYAKQGHELWFDKLMSLWDTCYSVPGGISEVMTCFSGLAKNNPGAVDWTPYVAKMFSSFLHALNLPVSYKDIHYMKKQSLDMKFVSKWIVWTINPDGVVLKQLKSFLAAVESYLHSANSGRWSFKLRDLLRKLAREFLNRVRRERETRYRRTWENMTPEAYKLRDEDITEFVNIVLEPTFQAVYSRSGALDISIALQNLATLRPAIVIPPLLEKLRTSLTSLTEPHRVTAAMSAVAAVARPMLRGADADYPEGRTHVVPFLMAVLPGLDPNDIKKTMVTLHFILMFSGMVPFIDCSSAHEHWPDLTEEELLVCESTAQFEDFVLVFLDRIFTIIESSVLEQARLDTKDTDWIRSKTDAVMETAITSAATAVLIQCSPKIFKEALRKFKSFATERTFETNVSGSMVGMLLHVFARIDSESTLAAFLPKLLEDLEELISNDEALREENPPRDLVYRLVLLMQVVDCDGSVLLKYIPEILPVLDRILKLHTRYALVRACEVLSHILNSLSYVDIKEWRSSPKDFGTAPKEWLPIREWGRGCLIKEAKFKWHVPSAEEAECAQMISDRYLKHEVNRLKQWLSGEKPMCKERRLRSFHIINAILSCSTFLPLVDEAPVDLLETKVPAINMPFTNGVPYTVTLDGENMRLALTQLLLEVQERMLTDKSDDTRGLEMLIQVWERIVFMKGIRTGHCLEARMRSFNALERALDGRGGVGSGGDPGTAARLRMLVADAARMQVESRLDLVCDAGITPTALKALLALYELSINTYSSVRILAQIRLYMMLNHFPYSYRALVPRLVELLTAGGEGEEWHARHKGALFIILGPKTSPIVAKQDWEVIRAIWPAVVKAPLNEKPSIHRLIQGFCDVIHRHYATVNTRLTISDSAIEAAKNLLNETEISDPEFIQQVNDAVEKEIATSDNAERLYNELIEELCSIAETSTGQWRRMELAVQLIGFCPLIQTKYPPRATLVAVISVIHDDILVRRHGMRLFHFVLKQCKHKLKKIDVDPYEIAGMPRPVTHVPGYRKDLEWAMWCEDKEITTDEEWDKPWLRNYSIGFYAWPKTIQVAAPVSEQKYSINTPLNEMTQSERCIFKFFTTKTHMDRFVALLTLEEKRGKDKFNSTRFSVFRLAFAHFGPRIATRLFAAAATCASDLRESSQRFAAEVTAAALRAPRYLPRRHALHFQKHALDIIAMGLNSVTQETMEDWGTCVATGVDKLDPLRGKYVLQRLLQECLPPPADDRAPDDRASFVLSARLFALQGAVGSMSWRGAPLAAEVLKRLDAANLLQHPYQNVREMVGSLIYTIFDMEIVFPGAEDCAAPRLKDFLMSLKPRLAALYDENGDIIVKSTSSTIAEPELPPRPPLTLQGQPSDAEIRECIERFDEELVEHFESTLQVASSMPPAQQQHARAANLLNTVFRGCMSLIMRGVSGKTYAQYELVSTACALAARGTSTQDELPRVARGFLACLVHLQHDYAAFDTALDLLEDLANSRSWWTKLTCLEFAEPLLFHGLPMLCDKVERAVRAEKFALKLMRDPRIEVRQKAGKVLTGLMHCRALPDEEETLQSLMKSCRSKELVERHCGVLGMCAYMTSRPYSLGPKLGVVLAELARHTSAPDPVPATIREALAEFRRTHQDDWANHRENLTEEELDLIADLTSPPTYCA